MNDSSAVPGHAFEVRFDFNAWKAMRALVSQTQARCDDYVSRFLAGVDFSDDFSLLNGFLDDVEQQAMGVCIVRKADG